jgi:hypothetical protein
MRCHTAFCSVHNNYNIIRNCNGQGKTVSRMTVRVRVKVTVRVKDKVREDDQYESTLNLTSTSMHHCFGFFTVSQ